MSKPDLQAPGARGQARRRVRGVVALSGVLAMLVTACGGTSGSDQSSGNSVGGKAPAVAKNQTITVGVATLQQQYADPDLANEGGNTYPIKWSVGEPLAYQAPDLSWKPGLATSWSVSPNKLTWTIKLRSGVKMQDGSDFTAQDVVTAIDRVKNPDFTSYAAYSSKIGSVKVVNPLELKITTKSPYGNLVYDTPAPVATAYYKKVGEAEFRKHPIAAGPFKFVSQKFNDSMTLERFDGFWDKTRLPNFKTLVLKIIPDNSARVSGVQTGQIDIAQGLTPNDAAQLKGVNGVRLISSKLASTAGIFFDDNFFPGSSSKLKDPKVRKALFEAIDRDAIANSLYKGFAEAATNFTVPGTDADDASLSPYPYDPADAKKLLAEAGASGLKITLHLYNATTAIPDVQKFAEAVAGYWKKVGVNVTLDVEDPATYLDKAVKHQLTGAVVLGVPGLLVSDPSNLSIFFSSTGAYSTLKNAAVDKLFAQMSAAVDPAEKAAAGKKLSKSLYDNLWGLPVMTVDAVYAVDSKIADFKMMNGNPYAGPFWYLRAY